VRKSIPPGIDPPSSLLPRRLDKPVYTAAGQSYADILKKQFSVAPDSTTTTANLRPPKKRQATVIDYDSDQSAEATPSEKHATTQKTGTLVLPTVDYAAELQLIKTELATLRTLLTTAVEQMQRATESIQTSHPSSAAAMEIEADQSTANRSKETTPELSKLINELKHDLATIALEMREKFKEFHALPQPIPFQLPPFPTFPT